MPSPPPQKQVRFNVNDTTYNIVREDSNSSSSSSSPEVEPEAVADTELMSSPPPPNRAQSTPSPTHSVSTVSTEGPFTPPAAPPTSNFGSLNLDSKSRSRGSPRSSPPTENRVYLHPLLLGGSISTSWDVTDRPSKQIIPDLIQHGSEMFAIFNPRKHPTIIITSPHIPLWPLYVDLTMNPTLEETLTVIQAHLNKTVSTADFSRVKRGERVLEAHARRCRAKRLAQGEPLRRVDYFLGRQVFYGLKEVEDDPTSWEVVLS